MKCPLCDVDLVMSERQGIEIDYCPKCRGVWLDRGELDKIIERSIGDVAAHSSSSGRDYDRDRRDDYKRRADYDYDRDYRYEKSRKKKNPASFLQDLFEFGGDD